MAGPEVADSEVAGSGVVGPGVVGPEAVGLEVVAPGGGSSLCAAGVEVVRGDLARGESLTGVCEGVTTLVHLAARIGGTEAECRAVNVEGTRALLAEARRAGVDRIVQVGTAAVYRDGAHRGAAEGELVEDPGSVTSVTRLEGERLVLAAGGTVLRPHLVYGRGDQWVVPSLLGLLARLPYWVDGGRARMSMVSVDALAGAVAGLAVAGGGGGGRAGAGRATAEQAGPGRAAAGRAVPEQAAAGSVVPGRAADEPAVPEWGEPERAGAEGAVPGRAVSGPSAAGRVVS
ncbi:NAD-dependent epimerase/dehydratase family protein, partial [Streptomyces bambusae]|nr:NAD-dependent epimerase/dehydratase family protein [Streptomyces bambusae]